VGDEKTVIAEDQLSWLSGKIKQALPSWATETATEKIGWAIKNNEHRMIGFLVYPGNYSMRIPAVTLAILRHDCF